ncbi:unnamed protein product, partial [Chrysoparadoxa australica]
GGGGPVARERAPRPCAGGGALDRAALDITGDDAIARALDSARPTIVINTAAYTAVDHAEDDEDAAFAINAEAPARLARACAVRGIALWHLSTDYVFDGGLDRPYRPDDRPNPASVYGRSKLTGEQAVLAAGEAHMVWRVSWVFGAGGANFVRTMLRLARERRALQIVADQQGGPTPADALAETLLALARRVDTGEVGPTGLWHFAGQPWVSWYGFAEAIFARAVASGLLERAPDLAPLASDNFPTRAARTAN